MPGQVRRNGPSQLYAHFLLTPAFGRCGACFHASAFDVFRLHFRVLFITIVNGPPNATQRDCSKPECSMDNDRVVGNRRSTFVRVLLETKNEIYSNCQFFKNWIQLKFEKWYYDEIRSTSNFFGDFLFIEQTKFYIKEWKKNLDFLIAFISCRTIFLLYFL